MSINTNEEITPENLTASISAAPAKKRATRKATSVATNESNAEHKPEKKVVAKKAAKKTAKKAAKKIAEPELFPTSAPEPEVIPATPAKKITRAKKKAAEPIPAPIEEPELSPVAESPKRFGRVPGGGPVAPRKTQELPASGEQESIPFPQQPIQSGGGDASSVTAPQNHESPQNPQAQQGESRSKKRREKRKRRKQERMLQQGAVAPNPQQGHNNQNRRNDHRNSQDHEDRRPIQLNGPKIDADGMLELAPKGFGFLRVPRKNFDQARDDVFVTPETIRKHNLRVGQWIHGAYQEGQRGPQLVDVNQINGLTPEEASKLPHFDELKAINPSKRISFETTPERFTTRVVDIMAPVGRGQRGLIVSPPRSGKTTLLLHMAEAIREKYDEAIHLMVVLVDERPEEVTEFRRALPGAEIYASSNDEQARNHCRIAELAIERAKRLVEAGKDVFIIMDSITRLARAYNGNMNNRGRGTGSGGITIGALEVPRRLFAAARNTRGGGSLTIMATALIQTNSRADEAIFMEFKGTGNMELVLDRKIAENYIYPAVDIFKSGTRREELLLADHMLHKIHLIRRGLAGHRPPEAMERLLFFLKKFPNNPQMLLEIKG
ncbi:MAG: transcription termination factor Rho [Akkermansiaceae bacterium]|nr:transcription termination factor Rho [Akkermansiaceae bacterium]